MGEQTLDRLEVPLLYGLIYDGDAKRAKHDRYADVNFSHSVSGILRRVYEEESVTLQILEVLHFL